MRHGVDVVGKSAIGGEATELSGGPFEGLEETEMAARVGLWEPEVDAFLALCELFVQGLDDLGTVGRLDGRSDGRLDKVSDLPTDFSVMRKYLTPAPLALVVLEVDMVI